MIRNILLLFMFGVLMMSTDMVVVAEATNVRCVVGDTNRTVEGVVVDEEGMPLQGVSILIMGTSVGTISDEQGLFSLKADKSGTLCFSYIGRKMQQIVYEPGAKNLKVVMPIENQELERIVVVGYTPDVEKEEEKDKSCGIDSEEEIFVVVEEMPEFPEGSLLKYLARQIKYPVKSLENREEGIVYVSFVVDCSGKVVNVRIAKGVSALLDKEALRIVNEMPAWKPGKQRGKTVKVQYILPIEFKLQPRGDE